MKISVNWIKEFTDIKCGIDELVTKIGAQLGEVEEVINLGEKYDGIVVAKVVSCEKHPNANKLQVCKIDDGKKVKGVKRDSKGYVQVVCGAPNVRKGITVAWIPPGAIVPCSFDTEKFKLEARELRGVVSNGMLASGQELAINNDHEGILIVDKSCNPGDKLADVYKLDDYIIDVENKMFTHRPDCFGQLGVAREIAGIQGIKFESPDWYLDVLDKFSTKSKTKLKLKMINNLPDLVPRFMAVAIANIKVQKSPIMIQSFLSRVGIKPINNIVDITNFVMCLTAQPMHAYDYDKLTKLDNAESATIMVRKPKQEEKIALLNSKTISPSNDAIMIASARKLIGVGGIMGGTETEVDSQTKNIILECATFDMYSIRRTSMEHGLFTDGVTRFSKGQSSRQNDKILAYAVAWINKLAGGEVAGDVLDFRNYKQRIQPVKITVDFINSRLGSELSEKQIIKLLENVEFIIEKKSADLLVVVPFWRTDIEIAEDIVEEIGRLYGFDKLPVVLPMRDISPATSNTMLRTKSKVRALLASAGANEVLTYSFVHKNLFEAVGQKSELAFQLSNALSPELQYYRLSLLPSLLDKIHGNIKAGHEEFALFEVNKTHNKSNLHEDGLPVEEEHLAFVFVADKKTTLKKYSGSPYYQAKFYAEELLEDLGFKNIVFQSAASHEPKIVTSKQMIAPLAVNRAAYIKTNDGKLLGVVGEIKQSVKNNLKLPEFIAGFEINLKMISAYTKQINYQPLLKYPATEQDISLKLDSALNYKEIYQSIVYLLEKEQVEHGYRWQIKPVDIYQKSENQKHVTIRISFWHNEKTLVTSEVNKSINLIVEVLCKKFNATRL